MVLGKSLTLPGQRSKDLLRCPMRALPTSIFPARDTMARSAFSIGFKNSWCSSLRIASISSMNADAICCFLGPSASSCSRRLSASRVDVTVVLVRKMEIPRDELQQHVLRKPHERPSADHAAFSAQYGARDESVD